MVLVLRQTYKDSVCGHSFGKGIFLLFQLKNESKRVHAQREEIRILIYSLSQGYVNIRNNICNLKQYGLPLELQYDPLY